MVCSNRSRCPQAEFAGALSRVTDCWSHALRFRAVLAALAEDLGSVPTAHMVAHNHPSFQFQGIQYSLLASVVTGMHVVYMHT